MKLIDLTLYENIRFYVMENQAHFSINMAEKSYMKIVMDFVEELRVENKIFAYMRISTSHQKTDRQKQTIIEYSVSNGFHIDEFVSDTITGGTKADERREHLKIGNTLYYLQDGRERLQEMYDKICR